MIHPDHLPYYQFTGRQRMDKALNTLRGFLKGMSADGACDTGELKQLERWIEDHRDLEDRHPFNEIFPCLRDALADGVLEDEEVADVLWLCDQLSEGHEYFDALTADMQQLQGVLGGVAADGVIAMEELDALSDWMDAREHLRAVWPYDELESLLLAIREDGRIDVEEHRILLQFFAEFTEGADHQSLSRLRIDLTKPPIGLCAVCPEIEFEGRSFCFTGASEKARRSRFHRIVTSLGGVVLSGVRWGLDYLVIGANGNPCWAYSCYGRKVEKAMQMRKEGGRTTIVHEHDFWDAVDDTETIV